MPLEKISGVGKVTLKKLHNIGLFVGEDVRRVSESHLIKHLGRYGGILWARCQGIDNRGVETQRTRKSVGVERTFSEDIESVDKLANIMRDKLIPELQKRAQKHVATRAIAKLGVKLKFNDFVVTTKEQKFDHYDVGVFEALLHEANERGAGRAVRLMGVHIGLEEPEDKQTEQMSLFA